MAHMAVRQGVERIFGVFRQKAACLIDHRYVFARHLRDSGGYKADNGTHLRLGNRHSGHKVQNNRGLGRLLVAHECRTLGQGKMHTGRADGAQFGDRTGQIKFLHPAQARGLDRTAGAHRHVCDCGKAIRLPLWQTFRRQHHAGTVKFIRTNGQRACCRIKFRVKAVRDQRVQRTGFFSFGQAMLKRDTIRGC